MSECEKSFTDDSSSDSSSGGRLLSVNSCEQLNFLNRELLVDLKLSSIGEEFFLGHFWLSEDVGKRRRADATVGDREVDRYEFIYL